VRRLLVAASVVPSSTILVTLMKEAVGSSETSVLTRATRRNILKYTILHSHRRETLKSYTAQVARPTLLQVGFVVNKLVLRTGFLYQHFGFPRSYVLGVTTLLNTRHKLAFNACSALPPNRRTTARKITLQNRLCAVRQQWPKVQRIYFEPNRNKAKNPPYFRTSVPDRLCGLVVRVPGC
jgi:hypothetical protein